MKKLIFLLPLFLSILCIGQKPFSKPGGYELIAEQAGDLDKDGISEKVLVFNTTDSTEFGYVREIIILKQLKGQWTEWRKSKKAILKSREGGMMGEPFEGIEIKNGILIISFSGGSSWKWSHQDKYRFQNNEFELIGYSSFYGRSCDYWADFDFNLSTGKIVYKKEFEDCDKDQEIYKTENETFYKKGVKVNLNNRNDKEIKLISPKYKYELYL